MRSRRSCVSAKCPPTFGTFSTHGISSGKADTLHNYIHRADSGKDTPRTSKLQVVQRDITLKPILLGVERDTSCTSILLMVQRDTPRTSTLLVVQRDTTRTSHTACGAKRYILHIILFAEQRYTPRTSILLVVPRDTETSI
jgi:hypothetical protein